MSAMIATTLAIVGFSPPASAKVVAGAITNVTVTLTGTTPIASVRTDINWCVPDGTVENDTFTLVLASQLGDVPPTFQIKDPANQAVVANAAISGSTPATVTFTLTTYAQTHQQVCGDAFFTGYLNSSSYAGTTQDFTYTSNDGTKFSTPVTIPAFPPIGRSQARKVGRFTRSDQCRDTAASCISWTVETPIGPSASGIITDTLSAGQILQCDTVKLFIGIANPSDGVFTNGVLYPPPTSPVCSTTGITVNYGAVPAGKLLQLNFSVSLPATDTTGGVTYSNAAHVVDTNPSGTVRDDRVSASVKSAADGGIASGVVPVPAVKILKDDANGNAADTAATAVALGDAPGAVGLVLTITNTGSEPLLNVVVTDQVVTNGTVTGLTCTFPDATTGTTWPGPFATKASFKCTAQLTGVATGAAHEDTSTVVGKGQFSGVSVTDTNGYFATASETTEVLGETGSLGSTSGGTSELANTGARVGGLLWLFVGLAASGGLLIFAGRRRNPLTRS